MREEIKKIADRVTQNDIQKAAKFNRARKGSKRYKSTIRNQHLFALDRAGLLTYDNIVIMDSIIKERGLYEIL